jgi:predicted RecA/RadA family phage recombinase
MIAASRRREDAEVKNFVQPGDYGVPIVVSAAVVSGQLLVQKAVVGVCACDGAAGSTVAVAFEGVYDLQKNVPDALHVGDVARVAAGSNIIAAAGTLAVGVVVQDSLAGAPTVRVRLTPSVGAPPTLLETHSAPPAKHEHEPVGAGKHSR